MVEAGLRPVKGGRHGDFLQRGFVWPPAQRREDCRTRKKRVGGGAFEIDHAVTIAVDATRPNYPPSTWLENFPGTVLRDSEANDAGLASGVSGIPYTLYLDGENRVVARSVGGLEKDTIIELWQSVIPQSS